jgi:histone H2A
LPVGRFHRLQPKGNYAERVGDAAPVYLATDVLDLSGNTARDNK